MRPKPALIMRARVLTVSVLAVPGTPSISACPSASKATSTCSIGSSWPTIILRSSFWICAIVEETYSGMRRLLGLKSFETALVIAEISLYVIHIAGQATELMINLSNYPLEVRQLHSECFLPRCEAVLSLSDLPNFDSNGFQRFAQWRGQLEKSRIDFVSKLYKLSAVRLETVFQSYQPIIHRYYELKYISYAVFCLKKKKKRISH